MVELEKPIRPLLCRSRARTATAPAPNPNEGRGCATLGALTWPARFPHGRLEENVADVWVASLDLRPNAIRRLSSVLSEAELERAGRFHFQRDRDRFIAGRAQLRTMLSCYLGKRGQELKFIYGPNGKPSLAPSLNPEKLHFNLAHSENLALIAISRLGPIGVDIERVRDLPDAQDLVARFFSARESAAFGMLPETVKAAAFFNLWTRKEAWLKATGEGIAHSLSRVEVSFLPGEPAALLSIAGSPAAAARWRLETPSPSESFVAALALPTSAARILTGRWNEFLAQT